MERGELYWVDFGVPMGSEPGYRRPVVIIQSNTFNQTKIKTVICAIISSNVELAEAPGNVLLEKENSGLSKHSVVNVSQLYTVDKNSVSDFIGKISDRLISKIDSGIRLVLDV
jgi:mRNA interferase MazF